MVKMKKIRFLVIILILWFFLIFLFDRFPEPIAFSSLAMIFVMAMVIFNLAFPRISAVQRWIVTIAVIILLLGIKVMRGELYGDTNFSLTILEILAIGITTFLVRWVCLPLVDFEKVVNQISLEQPERPTELKLSGHEIIYREVRRARNHQRPLALISVGINEKSIVIDGQQKLQEIQFFMLKQLKLRGLSKILCSELEDCAIIVKENDHFLAVLPETTPGETQVIMERLRQKASVELGVEIKLGMASLGTDSYTFEGLVDKANREMQNNQEPVPYMLLDQQPAEQPAKEF
jgi:hypothetical protein